MTASYDTWTSIQGAMHAYRLCGDEEHRPKKLTEHVSRDHGSASKACASDMFGRTMYHVYHGEAQGGGIRAKH